MNEEADLIKGRNESFGLMNTEIRVFLTESTKYWAERMQRNDSVVAPKKLKGTWFKIRRWNNLIRLEREEGRSPVVNILRPHWTLR